MAYMRYNKVLIIPGVGTAEDVVLPARIRLLGGGRGDAVIFNTGISHTATIPRHTDIVEDMVLSDGTYRYRVVEVNEIMDKYRLRLERL